MVGQRSLFQIKAGHYKIEVGSRTLLMGIVNATPDSFSQDGCWNKSQQVESVVRLAYRQIKAGADIIDIGGESTRPGALPVTLEEEIARVIPAIKRLAKKGNVPISIDTYKVEVAKMALDAGAVIVNNIRGTQLQKSLLKVIRDYKAAMVLMHMKGSPRTMQRVVRYKGDPIGEIRQQLANSIDQCLQAGIAMDQIIIDPGIGFGKTVEQNLMIIRRLEEFKSLGCPILLGVSRKSFIGKVLDKAVEERLNGTLAAVSASICYGAHIARVHDVKANKEVAEVMDAILNSGSFQK